MLRKIFRVCRWSLCLSVIALLAMLAISPFYIYNRFNQELPVASLTFTRTDEYAYIAELRHGDFCQSEQFTLLGDQFQLDAGFVKWKGIAVLLGFQPRYRLDRLSGRYSDIRLQNTRGNRSHDLAPDVLLDFFDENPSSGLLVDTSYGSSVYQRITPGLRYTVFATEDGLILRTETAQQFRWENGELFIDITHSCADAPSFMERFSEDINGMAISLLN